MHIAQVTEIGASSGFVGEEAADNGNLGGSEDDVAEDFVDLAEEEGKLCFPGREHLEESADNADCRDGETRLTEDAEDVVEVEVHGSVGVVGGQQHSKAEGDSRNDGAQHNVDVETQTEQSLHVPHRHDLEEPKQSPRYPQQVPVDHVELQPIPTRSLSSSSI